MSRPHLVQCRSGCVRFQACIIRPAGLICIGIGWGGRTGQTCWEHFAITRSGDLWPIWQRPCGWRAPR
jgi:hypothetical protein